MSIITIATININGITAVHRVAMLTNFLRRNEVNILLAQEVTNGEALNIGGYEIHHNIGSTRRGTAIHPTKPPEPSGTFLIACNMSRNTQWDRHM
jgi:exonuclease III